MYIGTHILLGPNGFYTVMTRSSNTNTYNIYIYIGHLSGRIVVASDDYHIAIPMLCAAYDILYDDDFLGTSVNTHTHTHIGIPITDPTMNSKFPLCGVCFRVCAYILLLLYTNTDVYPGDRSPGERLYIIVIYTHTRASARADEYNAPRNDDETRVSLHRFDLSLIGGYTLVGRISIYIYIYDKYLYIRRIKY